MKAILDKKDARKAHLPTTNASRVLNACPKIVAVDGISEDLLSADSTSPSAVSLALSRCQRQIHPRHHRLGLLQSRGQ